MTKAQHITCYLCGQENRLSVSHSRTLAVRCGVCKALLVDIVLCPSCGSKNRVKIQFSEHQKVHCGKCQTLLVSSSFPFERTLAKQSSSKNILRNALTIEAKLHQWDGEWEAAIQLFLQAQSYSNADDSEGLTPFAVNLGLCHAYLGNYEKAAEYLKHLDEAALVDFEVMDELARVYGLTGDVKKAIACFELTREMMNETTSRQHLNDLLKALYDIRDNATAGPISLQTCILLYDAMRDYESNNLQAGVQKLRRALELDPMDPAIYHQLGIGLLDQGHFEQAVSMLERGLEFDPMYEQAQFALGDAYFHLGMYECALHAYKQTLHLNPHNIDAYHHLGLVYEKQGEIDIAKGYWEDVLKVNPGHEEALRSLEHYGGNGRDGT